MEKNRFVSILLCTLLLTLTPSCVKQKTATEKQPLGKVGTTPEKIVSENGLTLILKQNPGSNIVVVDIFLGLDAASEGEKRGIRNLVQNLLLKGTKTRSAEELAFEAESEGIILDVGVSDDYVEIYAKSTKEKFVKSLELLADIIKNPVFSFEEVEKEKDLAKQAIKRQEDNLFRSTYGLFRETLYQQHPYAVGPLGTLETIDSITREDIVEFHRKYYTPNNMIISIVGNIDKDKTVETIKKMFGDMEKGKTTPKNVKTFDNPKTEMRRTVREKDFEQTMIIIGFLGPPITSRDYPVLKVINGILGQGMSARLFTELRDKKGLAYVVSSFYPSRKGPSHFVAYIGTSPEKMEEAEQGILAEFEKIKKEKIGEEELRRIKTKIAGDFIIDHEDNKSQAWFLGWYELLGVGYQYDEKYLEEIRAVTAEDILRVANKYFKDENIAIIAPRRKNDWDGHGNDNDEDGSPDLEDPDDDRDGVPDDKDRDQDGDGWPQGPDGVDNDGDGETDEPDEVDQDIDGDHIHNEDDLDMDNDGKDNSVDDDIDNDGIPNEEDDDMDGDGKPNDQDGNMDGDLMPNQEDDDVDGDGQRNEDDPDDDGDGTPDEEDPTPRGVPGGEDDIPGGKKRSDRRGDYRGKGGVFDCRARGDCAPYYP